MYIYGWNNQHWYSIGFSIKHMEGTISIVQQMLNFSGYNLEL